MNKESNDENQPSTSFDFGYTSKHSNFSNIRFPTNAEIANEWDKNAFARATELDDNQDITFNKITAPFFVHEIATFGLNSKVVDLGTGVGNLANKIAIHGHHVDAIDISKVSIELAEKRFPKVNFFNSSIAEFALMHESNYDVCVANMLLQNCVDLNDNLHSAYSLLKHNSLLLVSIPHPSLWHKTSEIETHLLKKYREQKSFKIPFQIRFGKKHPSQITYIHRPLEIYFRAFRRAGFSLEVVREFGKSPRSKDADLLFFVWKKI